MQGSQGDYYFNILPKIKTLEQRCFRYNFSFLIQYPISDEKE